jgi:hypothetical protein
VAEAKRDQNYVTVRLATSNADGVTPLNITADPVSHRLQTDDGTTGSDLSGDIASRDQNHVPVMMAVSSADGTTPTAIYIDATTKELLIDST